MPSPTANEVAVSLRDLRRTPEHFRRTSKGLADERLRRRPAADSWSLLEVLAHVRGAADVQGAWIARMIEEDTPSIRYASPRTGMRRTDHEAQAFSPFLRAFARQRNELVKQLSSLALDDWCRRASFTGTTPGWAPTVFDLASGLVTHERSHFEQAASAVGDATEAGR